MRKLSTSLIIFVALLVTVSSVSSLDTIGDPDPAGPCRVAHGMTLDGMKKAFYEGARGAQLAAIDASSCVDVPFDVLPYLAALMGARDRQVAARAAASVSELIEKAVGSPTGFAEVIEGQANALVEQLWIVAGDGRMDLDIRMSAFSAVSRIVDAAGVKARDYSLTLEDEDPLIRAVALAGFSAPIDDAYLGAIVKTTTEDDDSGLRGKAAALLCENALAHGVTEPSKDLGDILKTALRDGEIPAVEIGSILGCVKRFKVAVQGDFVDIALAHPDPAVAEFWKSL